MTVAGTHVNTPLFFTCCPVSTLGVNCILRKSTGRLTAESIGLYSFFIAFLLTLVYYIFKAYTTERETSSNRSFVIPAKAGIQICLRLLACRKRCRKDIRIRKSVF